MSILDRYIARHYLANILALLCIVASLIVAVDVIINLDRFIRRAEEVSAGEGSRLVGVIALIADLWGPRLLQLFTYLNGVVLIAAMGFTCANLVRHREFVAMLASGRSLHRAAGPFLVVAAALLAAQAAVHELALPRVAHLLPRDAGDAGRARSAAVPLRLSPDDEGRLWYARRFDDERRTLEDLAIWEHDTAGALSRVIVASTAAWDGTGWRFDDGVASTPANDDAAAPRPPERIAHLATSLDPERIRVRAVQGFASTLSWAQITRLIHSGAEPQTLEHLDRTRWGRISGLLCSFLALWGALAMFLVRSPRPMLLPALKAAPVALGGFAGSAIASTASIPGVPVWFGAFVPGLVLLSIAIALASGVET